VAQEKGLLFCEKKKVLQEKGKKFRVSLHDEAFGPKKKGDHNNAGGKGDWLGQTGQKGKVQLTKKREKKGQDQFKGVGEGPEGDHPSLTRKGKKRKGGEISRVCKTERKTK